MTSNWRTAGALALLLVAPPGGADVQCSGHSVQLAFGSVPSYASQPHDTSGVLTVTCSRDGGARKTTLAVGIGPSSHSGGIADRRMRLDSDGDALAYNIYRDMSMTSVWGQTPGVDTVDQQVDIPNKSSVTVSFVLFGRIPARQDVLAGSYSDNLLLQVNF